MKQLHLLAVLMVTAMLVASCSSNPSDPGRLTGNLHGRIQLLTECGMTDDHSGVTVKIEGTSFSAVTDSKGRWEVRNLPAGTYVIEYSKPGYATYKLESFQFVGGGEAYVTGNSRTHEKHLVGLPSWTFGTLSTEVVRIHGDSSDRDAIIRVNGTATASACSSSVPRVAWVFTSTRSSVSSSDYMDLFQTSLYGSDARLFEVGSGMFLERGYRSGTTVYMIAYPAGAVNQLDNPDTGKSEFEGLGSTPSNVVSFVMP